MAFQCQLHNLAAETSSSPEDEQRKTRNRGEGFLSVGKSKRKRVSARVEGKMVIEHTKRGICPETNIHQSQF